MTHTSTEQPYMPRATLHPAQEECIRLQARILELEAAVETGNRLLREEMARANRYAEASQAQRAPLTDEKIADLQEKYVGGPCQGYPLDASDWINFARAIEKAHGITQEKQG